MSNAVREKIEAYFASMNPTARRMMEDIKTYREKYIEESMDPEKQSEILWKSIVTTEAIEKYKCIPYEGMDVECFPVLNMKPGEKIIVEDDTASAKSFVSGTVYHDEHSAPFRWETQSQIDLRLHDFETEKEYIRTLEKDPPKSPQPKKQLPAAQDVSKSPQSESNIQKSSESEQDVLKSPVPERKTSKASEPEQNILKSPKPERSILKSPKPERSVIKSPKPERSVIKSPKLERNVLKTPKPERSALKSFKPELSALKSPKSEQSGLIPPNPSKTVESKRRDLKSPIVPERTISKLSRQDQISMNCLPLNPSNLKSSKMDPKSKSQSNLARSPAEFSLCSPVIDIRGSLKSLGPESHKFYIHGFRRDDDTKRPSVKRPDVPPPPVPPHVPPPVPPHAATLPVPVHKAAKTENKSKETPIYAKVVKRKSANAKTLMMSELNIHKKNTEEMKPAVPPRMSLELKADMNLMKYTAHTIDIDGIPKTGFDFLDNW